jgi:vacuolar-type H+-ATPase subunit E/Vma4
MEKYFHVQFMAIGNNLARKAKNESKKIRTEGEQILKRLNSEFVRKVQKDLYGSTLKFLKNYEYRLNQQISDNINDLNQKILIRKNEMFQNFIQSLYTAISDKIEKNYSKYKEFIIESIIGQIKLFDSKVKILLINRDQGLFKEIIDRNSLKNLKISLGEELKDSIGGFILKSSEIIVDATLENQISKSKGIIKQYFTKLFPEYVDLRKSATELMRERNIKRLYDIPQELNDFIKENDVNI